MSNIISFEELEEALSDKVQKQKEVLSEVSSLFDDAGFFNTEQKNNITFQSTKRDVKALFSIDNTTYNYSYYITTEGDNSTNYSGKGNIDGVVDAAYKFIEQYSDIVDVPEEDVEEL